jgi:hypothetical protein
MATTDVLSRADVALRSDAGLQRSNAVIQHRDRERGRSPWPHAQREALGAGHPASLAHGQATSQKIAEVAFAHGSRAIFMP